MGCVSSKKARAQSPAFDDVYPAGRSNRPTGPARLASSGPLHVHAAFGPLEKIKEEPDKETEVEEEENESGNVGHGFEDYSGNLRSLKRGASQKKAVFSIKFGRLSEGEQVAAGWPAWLSAVAGDAIDGWVPLRSDAYERLERVIFEH